MTIRCLTILITRPREQSEELVRAIEQKGGRALVVPMIQIMPPESWEECDEALGHLAIYDGIILTSTNAVDGFVSRALTKGIGRADFSRCVWYAVGKKTGERIEQSGGRVEFIPDNFSAAALAEELERRSPARKRFLLPCGDQAREELKRNLEQAGAHVETPIVYRTAAPSDADRDQLLDALTAGEIDVVTFASPSAARNFAAVVPTRVMAQTEKRPKVVALGSTTAEAIRGLGYHVDAVATEASISGFVAAIGKVTKQ
jgi:uroporphyrinogen-III synthase